MQPGDIGADTASHRGRHIALALTAIVLIVLCAGLVPRCVPPFLGSGLCNWQGKAQAWLDANENGAWDAGEAPLPNVHVVAEFKFGNYTEVRSGATNVLGDIEFYMGAHGNCRPESVYPIVPDGYRLTTAARVDGRNAPQGQSFPFGFASVDGAPAPVPYRTEAIACTTYRVEQYLRRFAMAPDGSLWGVLASMTGDGHAAARVVPGETWELQARLPVTPTGAFEDVAAGTDGTVWLAGGPGAASYDGTEWTWYPLEDIPGLTYLVAVAPAAGGSAWLASHEGLARLDTATGQWVPYLSPPAERSTRAFDVAVTADGTPWLARGTTLSRLVLPGEPGGAHTWQTVPLPPGKDCAASCIRILAAAAGGRLWVAGSESDGATGRQPGWAAEFDPAAGTWAVYDNETTRGALLSDGLMGLAPAPDGSAWLNTPANGIIHLMPAADRDPARAQVVYYPDSIGRLPGELALTPDGALWAAASAVVKCVPAGR